MLSARADSCDQDSHPQSTALRSERSQV
jgi:hypothetical protein